MNGSRTIILTLCVFCYTGLYIQAQQAGRFKSETALGVTNRVAEIYLRRLDQRDDAIRVLENYIETFPDAERTDSVRTRLDRIVESGPVAPSLPPSGELEIPPEDPSG